MIEKGNTEHNTASSQLLETEVVTLFRQLAESLPAGSVSLEIKPNPEPLIGGTRVELVPVVSGAARIVAIATNRGVVYLTFGKSTPFEAQVERGSTPSKLIEDIRPFCKAVIEGKFEENIWLVGSRAFKSVGKLEVGGKIITIHYRGSFHPFEKTENEHIKYAPFTA